MSECRMPDAGMPNAQWAFPFGQPSVLAYPTFAILHPAWIERSYAVPD